MGLDEAKMELVRLRDNCYKEAKNCENCVPPDHGEARICNERADAYQSALNVLNHVQVEEQDVKISISQLRKLLMPMGNV